MKRYKPLQAKTPLQSKKRINTIGRIGKYRQKRKKQWIKDHPPDDNGLYRCCICDGWVHISEMKLEHNQPKGSTPGEIAEADDNLGPSHSICNRMKGSKRI